MPQLWLTYGEIAREFGCDPLNARGASLAHGWPRKKSRDGETRVLMPPSLMHDFMLSVARRVGGDGASDRLNFSGAMIEGRAVESRREMSDA